MRQSRKSRRNYLKALGVAGVAGLAGCASNPDEGGGDEGSQETTTATTTADGGDDGDTTTTESEGGASGNFPDVLTVIGYPASGIQIFRDFYADWEDSGIDILVPDGLQQGDLPDQVGNSMDNVTGTVPSAVGPNREAFADLFRDEYGQAPSVFTYHTFDAVAILILANAAAGENVGESVRDQMRRVSNGDGMEVGPGNLVEGVNAAARGEKVNYQGASSPTDFDKRGDPAAAAYGVWEFADTETGYENIETINFSGDAGGASADSAPGGTDRTVKVGLLLPETGDLAAVGKPMIQAGELAAKVVNAGDANVDIDLAFQDSQTSPQAGINAANSLVNEGYPAIAGPASSGVNVPVSQNVYIPNQVVGCSPSSTALSVSFLEDDDYIFRTAPSDLLQGQVMAQVAADNLGASTTSTMYVNNDYGQQLSDQFTSTFTEDHSGSVWQKVGFQKEQASYTSVLQKALSE
jgi:ABC-type branched-subunit amino acid transport system substrate-binding protein